MSARNPEGWVSNWRTVTPAVRDPCSSGREVATGASSRTRPAPRGRTALPVLPTPLAGGGSVLAPHARNAPPAGGAATVRADPLARDHVPGPLDEQIAAIGTPGVLPAADPARDVPSVHELEACLRSDLAGADERLRRGVVGVGHAVVLVKRGDVPGDLGAHRGDVLGGAPELRAVVVEAGHDEGHHLEPEAALVHHADRVQDVLQYAAELAVAPVIHRLEVDLVAVGPGTDVVEHFGRGVAVRDKRRLEAARVRRLEHVHGPFGGDERLVVRRPDQLGALAERQPHQAVGRHVRREHARGGVAQRLAGEPVLAVAAVEVAPQHPEGERVRAREGVEERLLLGGIALQGGDVSGGRVQGAVLVEAHLADAAAPRFDETAVPAGEAANRAAPVRQPLDQLALAHPGVERLRERGDPSVGRSVHENLPCLPFINIARSARAQPPTRSEPGASWYRSRAVAISRADSSRTLGAAYMRSPGSCE